MYPLVACHFVYVHMCTHYSLHYSTIYLPTLHFHNASTYLYAIRVVHIFGPDQTEGKNLNRTTNFVIKAHFLMVVYGHYHYDSLV